MYNKKPIQRASRRLRYLLMVLFWGLPVINICFWIFLNHLPEMITRHLLPYFADLSLRTIPRDSG